MNITYHHIYSFLKKEAIEKTILRLKNEGFTTRIDYEYKGFSFDLFAYKNLEKRIYEFKITKNKTIQSPSSAKKFELLQQAAKEMGARLIYIYINPPFEGASVSFDGLEDLLFDDLNKNKSEIIFLKSLSSPTIQMIFDVNIGYISIKKECIFICGSALADIETISVDEDEFYSSPKLDYLENNNHSFRFEITLSKGLNIIKSKYIFDDLGH